jgi:protein O-GlcNAc transferase
MSTQAESYKAITSAEDAGNTAVVVELCQRHLRRFPGDGFVWIWNAMAKVELGLYKQAEKSIDRAIDVLPKKAVHLAFVQMGHLFRARGNLKRALYWYQRALRLAPKDAGYHIFVGSILAKQGLLKQAERRYRRAISCSNGSVEEAQFNLGGVLLANKRYREAIVCYQNAIQIDPDYAMAKKRLEDAELALKIAESGPCKT